MNSNAAVLVDMLNNAGLLVVICNRKNDFVANLPSHYKSLQLCAHESGTSPQECRSRNERSRGAGEVSAGGQGESLMESVLSSRYGLNARSREPQPQPLP